MVLFCSTATLDTTNGTSVSLGDHRPSSYSLQASLMCQQLISSKPSSSVAVAEASQANTYHSNNHILSNAVVVSPSFICKLSMAEFLPSPTNDFIVAPIVLPSLNVMTFPPWVALIDDADR